MRTHQVEFFTKAVELSLLCRHAAGRWDRRLLFERTMHPLMDAVLLRFSRLDQLGVDAQLDEPHPEPCQSIRCERCTVIRSYAIGQSIAVKYSSEMAKSLLQRDLRVCINTQQEAG